MRLAPGPALSAWAASAGLCASVLAAAPAAARPADMRPASPSTVVVAWSAMPAGTDPLVTGDQYSADIESLLYDPLYYETPELAYAPDLARTWQVRAGGRTYTYILNPKARWSSGRPVRAADVVASLRAYASPRDTGAEAGRFKDLLTVRAVGPEMVRVRLRRPDPAWPGLLAGLPILPAPAPSAAKGAAPSPPAVTDGPYDVRRWDAQTGFVSLAANPAYFRGAPHVARLEVRVVPSPAAALAGLRRGTLQVALLPPDWAAVVHRTPGLTGHAVDGTGVALIAFNVAAAPLRQAAVRRALVLAVDRTVLIHAMGQAGAEVPPGPWPAALGGASPAATAFDPALARRLLAAAGWRVGTGGGGVRRRDGRPLALTLRYPTNAPVLARAVAVVAGSWRRVGVGVRLAPAPLTTVTASAASGAYQALALGAAFGGGAALGALLGGRSEFPPRGEDVARYANPLVTALLRYDGQGAAEAAPPPAVLDALATLLAEDPPYLPLWSDTSLVVTSATLSNFIPNPWGPDLYQAQRWILP